MKKFLLLLALIFMALLCTAQNKWITYRELILPKDIGINHFCNNRFQGNYYIGNYWATIKIPIKIEEPKPYTEPKIYKLDLKTEKYKCRLFDVDTVLKQKTPQREVFK